ncbi:jg18248 [Pararge aegeria aegeria]|uniref:Jg18248 protein n=1 Tax=Pararge aegeria aegeria TaxID=348720 RepID=A0A8S4SJ67_9NEOP|nr:jg18248 [Pararge aegeria aegeria]
MVGKGDSKNSRIFTQCYLKCCKLQNLIPINNVLPSGNGKVLDFCVDRLKYADWPPILNALSCDLSLHSVSIKCRQQVKTVLEQIDCERLAKTVNKRAVILTNFMLSNLMEAISQLLSNTTLLTSLQLEGLPLKIPYLNPLSEVLLRNSSLRHIYLPRCLIGDAGCLAICKAVRCLPNILTMDLSGCELTPLGAGYIADLIKYQKIHRYSENWVHTLRYRLPELDTMAGLRRITLCGNQQFGDAGVKKLLDVLADDLWIKALDLQNCGLTEDCASAVLHTMTSNTTLVVLDIRHNALLSSESLSKIRSALRENERGTTGQYAWLGNLCNSSSEGRVSKNGMIKERVASNVRTAPNKYNVKANIVKKEKDYTEALEEQLQDETTHRRQLEELNERLVQQMRSLKQQQIQLWQNSPSSSSEQSFQASSRSGGLSTSSGSTSSVPIDQNTLSYIQQAFKDIYAFIKNNQCQGQCLLEKSEDLIDVQKELIEGTEVEQIETKGLRIAKKAQSTHLKLTENGKVKKMTKSAHLLGDMRHSVKNDMKLEMVERKMGDTNVIHGDDLSIVKEVIAAQKDPKRNIQGSPCSSVVSDSSDTLVYSPKSPCRESVYQSPCIETVYRSPRLENGFKSPRQSVCDASRECAMYQSRKINLNPRDAMYSSSDDDS